MNTQQLLEKLYGVKLYKNTEVLNTDITSAITPVASNDPGAVFVMLVNTGANDLVVWTDESVSSSKGILLAANGGYFTWNATQHFIMPTESLYAVCPAGTTTVSFQRYSILQGQ